MCGKIPRRATRVLLVGLRLLLAFVLILTGIAKLESPLAFRQALDAYCVFPSWIATGVAIMLPPFEVFCGIGLLIPKYTRASALAACGMMAAFSLMLVWAIWSGKGGSCGCFGRLTMLSLSPPVALVRNICLFVAAGVVYRAASKSPRSVREFSDETTGTSV